MFTGIKSQKWGWSRVCFAAAALVIWGAARPAAAAPASFTILSEHPTQVGLGFEYLDVSADGAQVCGSTYLLDSNGVQLIDSNGQRASRAYRWNAEDGMVILDPGLGSDPQGYAYAISPDGSVIVGGMLDVGAFWWTGTNGFTAMSGALPGGTYVQPFSVSVGGAVVAGYGYSTLGYGAAAVLADGTVIELGDLQGGKYESQAADVSDDGNILVGYGYADGYTDWGVRRAVLWDATNNYNISVLDMSAITGQWWGTGGSRARAVSGDGTTIVGEVFVSDGGWVAFRWTEAGGAVVLGDLSGGEVWSRAMKVSQDGSIVTGLSSDETMLDGGNNYAPFIWSAATGMLDYRDVLAYFGLDLGDWTVGYPYSIQRTPDGITFVGGASRSTVPGQRSDVNGLYRAHVPFLPMLNEQSCSASWDSSTGIGDPGLVSKPNEPEVVSNLAVFDDGNGPALYARGFFTYAGGSDIGGAIAKWDGQKWLSLGGGLRGVAIPSVQFSRVLDDGTGSALYVVGDFLIAGNILADRMAKWDGQAWSAMGTGFDLGFSWLYDLEVFDDGTGPAIYAAAVSDSNEGGVFKWTDSQWVQIGSGFFQSNPSYTGKVTDIAVFDDGTGAALYATGLFSIVDGLPASGIAKWDGQSWSEVGGGVTVVPSNDPQLLVWDDGTGVALYGVGVHYPGGDPNISGGLVKWDGQSWSDLVGPFVENEDETGGGHYVGGFPGAPGASMVVVDDGNGPALVVNSMFGIAKWDGGQVWSPFFPLGSLRPQGGISSMVNFDDGLGNGLYFGGGFGTVDGVTLSRNIAMERTCTVPLPGDCDSDGDVDMLDFETFSNCLSGPGIWMGAGCDCADVTGNGVVALRDFQAFMKAFTG